MIEFLMAGPNKVNEEMLPAENIRQNQPCRSDEFDLLLRAFLGEFTEEKTKTHLFERLVSPRKNGKSPELGRLQEQKWELEIAKEAKTPNDATVALISAPVEIKVPPSEANPEARQVKIEAAAEALPQSMPLREAITEFSRQEGLEIGIKPVFGEETNALSAKPPDHVEQMIKRPQDTITNLYPPPAFFGREDEHDATLIKLEPEPKTLLPVEEIEAEELSEKPEKILGKPVNIPAKALFTDKEPDAATKSGTDINLGDENSHDPEEIFFVEKARYTPQEIGEENKERAVKLEDFQAAGKTANEELPDKWGNIPEETLSTDKEPDAAKKSGTDIKLKVEKLQEAEETTSVEKARFASRETLPENKERAVKQDFAEPKRIANKELKTTDNEQHAFSYKVEVEPVAAEAEVESAAAAKKLDLQDAEEFFPKIVKQIDSLVKDERSEVRIQLKPDYLGEMKIKIAVERGLMTAEFVVENERVREIIAANLPHLRTALQEQGGNIAQMTVNVGVEQEHLKDNSKPSNLRRRISPGKAQFDGKMVATQAKPNPWHQVDLRA